MSILDTTAYFKSVYTKKYIPFENSYKNHEVSNMKKKDNFCPICHYNWNSHYHRTKCKSQLPIGNELILFIFAFIYLIIKIKLKIKS